MRKNRKLLVLASLVAASVFLFYLSGFEDFLVSPHEHLLAFVREKPLMTALIYVPVYLGFVSFGAPSAPFQVTAAALFIPVWGYWPTLGLLLAAINLAGFTTYGLGRWLGIDLFRSRSNPKLARLKTELKKRGAFWIIVLRLIPAVPFSLLSYGAAVCQIPAPTFFTASSIGIVPITIVHASLGQWAARKLK